MNRLPVEIWTKIFSYLDLNDLLKCRLVNKKCQIIIENNIKIKSLVIRRRYSEFKKLHHYFQFKSIEFDNHFMANNHLSLRSKVMKPILKNLKQLFIDPDYSIAVFENYELFNFIDSINQFTSLEQLEIHELHLYESVTLNLPNLTVMKIHIWGKKKMTLNTPNLKAFKTRRSIDDFNFKYPESVIHLSVMGYNPRNVEFVNVEYFYDKHLEMDYYMTFKKFPKLKELHTSYNVHYITDEFSNWIVNKDLERRVDFKFFVCGIEIDTLDDLNQFKDSETGRFVDLYERFQSVLNKYDQQKVTEFLPWIYEIDYNLVRRHFNQINEDFIKKFINVRKVIVEGETNPELLIQFLKKLKHSKGLKLVNSSIDQAFLNQIPIYQPNLEELQILETTKFNLDFVLELKNLYAFEIDQRLSYELVTKLLELSDDHDELGTMLSIHKFELKFKFNKNFLQIYASNESVTDSRIKFMDDKYNFSLRQDLLYFLKGLLAC